LRAASECVDNPQPLAILGRIANTAGNKAVRAKQPALHKEIREI
jgi:hypothetical protein